MKYLSFLILLLVTLCLWSCSLFTNKKNLPKDQDWRSYGGNAGGDRYSSLNQINLKNVKDLQLAWTYKTGENGEMQTQPIVVNGIFY